MASVADQVHLIFKLITMIENAKPTYEDTSNGNCAKPLLAVVDFFNGYFSTVLSEKKTNI